MNWKAINERRKEFQRSYMYDPEFIQQQYQVPSLAEIDENSGVVFTGDWGEVNGTERQKADALRIRTSVVPRLHDDQKFQQAIRFILEHLEHETVADVEQMERLEEPTFDSD